MKTSKTRRSKSALSSRAGSRPKPPPAAAKPPAAGLRAQYLTPNEVADRLLVATVTVRLWATKGLLPSVTTLGGHRRFRVQDVEEFVARHQQAKPSLPKPPRVLIIDTDQRFSRYLAGVIATQVTGAVVQVAHDGFSAGIKCVSIRPDVVTLDLQMPDVDGVEVCSMLRNLPGKSKPRIVALTGVVSPSKAERIIAAGADACVPKNTSAGVLLKELGLTRLVEA